MKSKSKAIRVDAGIECYRCGQLTDKMEHEPGWTPKPGKTYLSYWYVCRTVTCPANQINPRCAYVKTEPLPAVDVVFDIDVVSTLPISDANDPNPPW